MTTSSTQPMLFQDDLDEAYLQRYMNSRYLAVDTETMGLQVLRDHLCVVQMCNEDGVIALVQTKNFQAPRLKTLLEAENVEKIFHFARFDLASLQHWLGILVRPVFCTKIASRLIRTYSGYHGLKDLSQELLGVDMDKKQQSSDWGATTLSSKQLSYAASDVINLVAIKEALEAMLLREGRLKMAKECMAFLPTRVELDLAGWESEDIFSHH